MYVYKINVITKLNNEYKQVNNLLCPLIYNQKYFELNLPKILS